MFRRPSALLLGTALVVSAAGCRTCNNPHGWFSSNTSADVPCQLTSRPMDGCYDAITGQPVPCSPPTTLIPGGTYPGTLPPGTRPDELPFPAPSDLIPPQRYAVPGPAPGSGEGASANPKGGAIITKGVPNK